MLDPIRKYYIKKLKKFKPYRGQGKTFYQRYYEIRAIAGIKWYFMSKKEKQELAESVGL